MGLNSALFNGLSGMAANSEWITVAGDNIANVNTLAFKASRMQFETQFSQLVKPASAPTAARGGSNPAQIGLGVRIGAITRDFNPGARQVTGTDSHVALTGDGFFILDANGSTKYTRAGNFTLDEDYTLVNPNGAKVQGFTIDQNFNIIGGVLSDLKIPLGVLSLAEATTSATITGKLNAGKDSLPATQGSTSVSSAMFSDAGATVPVTAADDLTSIFTAASGGTPIFAAGDVITVSGIQKGNPGNSTDAEGAVTLPPRTFEVGAANTTGSTHHGTTVQDYLDFLQGILGIDDSQGGAGVTITAGGEIEVVGNSGELNDISMGSMVVSSTSSNPLVWNKTQFADGYSQRATFPAYNTLGSAFNVDLTFVLNSKPNSGTVWDFYVHSQDDTDLDTFLSNGTLSFDTDGNLNLVSGDVIFINQDSTGAATPQQIRLNFHSSQLKAAQPDGIATVSAQKDNGIALGDLEAYQVSGDGTIVGLFSNGQVRPLGQIAVATFSNPEGLVEQGSNLYNVSPNSGTPVITTPGSGGAGHVVGAALELSNVELSEEFINLINASTGFSANSRVITTSERLIQELLNMVR
jgi:flagellar hook protein FlgE